MNATEPLTDDLIQAAFERRADRADRYDLRALQTDIVAATGGARQRSRWSLRLAARRPTIAPRPVWVAIAVLAALLGLAVALVLIGQRPSTPFRTGLLAFVRDGDVYLAIPTARTPRWPSTRTASRSRPLPGPRTGAASRSTATLARRVDLATGAATYVGGWQPAWSPDGRELAVLDNLPATDAPCAPCTAKALLRIVDVATGTTSRSFRSRPSPGWPGPRTASGSRPPAERARRATASSGSTRPPVLVRSRWPVGSAGFAARSRLVTQFDSDRIRPMGIERGFCEGGCCASPTCSSPTPMAGTRFDSTSRPGKPINRHGPRMGSGSHIARSTAGRM